MVNMSLVVVTGLSGAGKSTASKALEDLGYYTIDNMPLFIIEQFMTVFLDLGVNASKIALVIDVRSGDSQTTYDIINLLKIRYNAKVIFLTANSEVLIRRYKESRRKHPLGVDPAEAIALEEGRLKEIKAIADIVIDTSTMNVHEFNREINGFFQNKDQNDLSVTVSSFGFKHGLPVDSDIILDVRFLRNPYFVENMRHRTGLEKDVADYVLEDPVSQEFFAKLTDLVCFLVPQYRKEGKRFLKISIGCTGGHHRSVAFSEKLADYIRENCGVAVQTRHRDLQK